MSSSLATTYHCKAAAYAEGAAAFKRDFGFLRDLHMLRASVSRGCDQAAKALPQALAELSEVKAWRRDEDAMRFDRFGGDERNRDLAAMPQDRRRFSRAADAPVF